MGEMPRSRTLSAMVFCRIWIWPALSGRPYNRTAIYLVHLRRSGRPREPPGQDWSVVRIVGRSSGIQGCWLMTNGRCAPPPRNRWFVDSPVEGTGFELLVPSESTADAKSGMACSVMNPIA